MAKFSERFFCPAPWDTIYHHINSSSPCHLIKNPEVMSPLTYLKSGWLKQIKQDFVDNKVPSTCVLCKQREDQGLKSTRGAIWKYSGFGVETSLDISKYTVETEKSITRIEVRFSNLCNFKCRMCGDHSSSEIAKENQSRVIPLSFELSGRIIENSIYKAPDSDIEEIKQLCLGKDLFMLCFTGGEPLLIKEYYDLLDFMIENNKTDILIELFTNCSVYNPKFIDRLSKFTKINFVMSIDGVEKTAEYQRHGTKWDVVRSNIVKFNSLPFTIYFNTTITGYVLLDVSSLAKFLMELYEQNKNIKTKCYSVPFNNKLHHRFLTLNLRKAALTEIDKAVEILTPKNFQILTTELKKIKYYLITTAPDTGGKFKHITDDLDNIRNESFEDTFNLKF